MWQNPQSNLNIRGNAGQSLLYLVFLKSLRIKTKTFGERRGAFGRTLYPTATFGLRFEIFTFAGLNYSGEKRRFTRLSIPLGKPAKNSLYQINVLLRLLLRSVFPRVVWAFAYKLVSSSGLGRSMTRRVIFDRAERSLRQPKRG